ncbi:armadillo-type protein [Umbelopsis sp. PMI_123]|nr:armadillo-type protein [Umbelopsis sp. PMI_123]
MAQLAMNRPEVIQSLIDGVDRYNPDNISILEEYLATQCQNEEYDLMANLAALKLYQFNPHLTNDRVTINILAKALTAVPAPDFNLCLYLLTEPMIIDEPIKQLTALHQLLEQSRYAKFWETYKSESAYEQLVAEVRGFDQAIRNVVARVVSMTHQQISSSLLESYLDLKGDDFAAFVKEQNWEIKGALVQIPVNKDNEAKTVVIRENIKFEQLTKVIGYSNEM